jgi:hypothetical protein
MRKGFRPHIDSDDDDGEDTTCVAISMMPVNIVGKFSRHEVHHRTTWSMQDTNDKKRRDKEIRMAKTAEKVHELAAAAAAFSIDPQSAPNPFAAARACAINHGATDGSGALAFAASYGAEDAFAVARSSGEADFVFADADEEDEDA